MQPFRTIPLSEIALRDLRPFKVTLAHFGSRDHCRWVFRGALRDSPGTFFFKIWNPTYVRRDNLPAAVRAGFYDETLVPALHALIFHEGLCRGYVMHEGDTRHGQPIDELRARVFSRTRETGWFFVQFGFRHTMLYEDRWSLLDLEGTYPLRDFPRLPQLLCTFEDLAYLERVADLYRESAPAAAPGAAGSPGPLTEVAACAAAARPPDEAVVNRFSARLARLATRKFRNLVPRTHLIEGLSN